jgi:hypothetical protein
MKQKSQMKKNKLTLRFGLSEYATRQHHPAHGKEFSSVTDEFLPLCRSYLRAVACG